MKLNVLFLTFMMCLLSKVWATAVRETERYSNSVVVCGQVLDENEYLFSNPKITVYHAGAMDYLRPLPYARSIFPVILEKGNFYHKIKTNSNFIYVKIELSTKTNILKSGYLLLKAGDSLKVIVNGEKVKLSGSNPASLRFQQEFYEASLINKRGLSLLEPDHLWPLVKAVDSLADVFEPRWKSIGGEMGKLLSVEYRARANSKILFRFHQLRTRTDQAYSKALLNALLRIQHNMKRDTTSLVLDNTISYFESLWFVEKTIIELKASQEHILWTNLMAKFRTFPYPLNDRMMAYVFWKGFRGADPEQYLKIAKAETKDQKSVKLLNYFDEINSRGRSIYDFRLPDINGKYYQPKDFLGKVMVLHFWFTNCYACAELSKTLHPIIEKYRNSDKVVFLNINIDRDIEKWKSSLKGGMYSHPKEIMLYTEKMGADHPLLINYSIKAFPRIMVVGRDGKLISSDAVRPIDNNTTIQFENMLN